MIWFYDGNLIKIKNYLSVYQSIDLRHHPIIYFPQNPIIH